MTGSYAISASGAFRDPISRDELEAMLDNVTTALVELDAQDPSVSVDFARSIMEVNVTVDADSPEDALRQARSLILEAVARSRISVHENAEEADADEWTVSPNRKLALA